MKIGLLDIDSHAKVKKRGATVYPNLALCKIAAYHRTRGDIVEWASQMEHYDILYRAKVFTFSPDDNSIYNADKVVRGGTGYDVHSRLPQEIDDCQPDLSILPGDSERCQLRLSVERLPKPMQMVRGPRKRGDGKTLLGY